MKNQIKIITLFLVALVGLSQCKKNNDVPYSSKKTTLEGMYKISSFDLNGADHTDFYNNYTFEFKPGFVVARKDGKEMVGKWKMEGEKLSLKFGEEEPLNFLNNEAWDIIKTDLGMMQLRGGTGTDGVILLTFSK
jgi:hypothetical protein